MLSTSRRRNAKWNRSHTPLLFVFLLLVYTVGVSSAAGFFDRPSRRDQRRHKCAKTRPLCAPNQRELQPVHGQTYPHHQGLPPVTRHEVYHANQTQACVELRISSTLTTRPLARSGLSMRQTLCHSASRAWNRYWAKASPSPRDLTTATRITGGADTEYRNGVSAEGPNDQENGTPSKSRAFLGNLDNIRKRSFQIPKAMVQSNGQIVQRMKSAADAIQQRGSRAVPPVLTTLSLICNSEKGISLLSLYGLALLGASCGFHLFLHFITLGYALGIGLPISVALYVYSKRSKLPSATIFHSMMTIIWSIRLFSFFMWREYISWPALHEKVIEIQRKMTIPFASRLLCWFVYSFFYLSMMSMSWNRLRQGSTAKWGILGMLGLLMQVGGLTLETLADYQKNNFKSKNRHVWCNIGVWSWSTHPNYLGEGLFWFGSYFAHGFSSIPGTLFATIGLGFITSVLKGSTRSLSMKHMEKYGDQAEFVELRRAHGIWGPKHLWTPRREQAHLNEATVADFVPEGNSTNISNVSATDESAQIVANS